MRALCGAIITAGAAIGLGLSALGVGTRYQMLIDKNAPSADRAMHLFQMDTPLIFCIVFLTVVTVIGLGIAFLGLAYHHHRRHHEHLWELERRGLLPHTPAPPAGTPSP
jgi:cell division protein FtsX